MLKKMSCLVVLTLCLLALVSPVKAGNEVEFGIYSMDSTHGGTADTYYAEICIDVDGATGVRMDDGDGWGELDGDGSGEFWGETDDFASLSGLIADIEGIGQKLEITCGTDVSIYSFTIKGGTSAEFNDIEAKMPAPTPIITTIVPKSPGIVTLSWTWGGNTGNVTGLCVGAEARVGGNWQDMYDECSDDTPAEINITDLSADIDGHPASYEEIEYWVGYGNLEDVGAGVLISDWTLNPGDDELFGGTDDGVIEVLAAEDFLVVPEPMTLSLLAIGGLATLIRRKR